MKIRIELMSLKPKARFLRKHVALWAFLGLMCTGAGCGYKVTSSTRELPFGIQSLGIPIFRNATHQFKLEQQLSRAVMQEFSARTRIPISAATSGVDAVLEGEITNMSSTPVTFGTDTTFGSTFLITVQMRVKLTRPKDSSVLWENSDFLFRERYVINSKVSDFFSEENPALDRLSQQFASSLVSTILNR